MEEGCKYPTHFFCFSAADYLSPCLSMPLIYNVYYDSTHIHAKWLAKAQGGTFKKTIHVELLSSSR